MKKTFLLKIQKEKRERLEELNTEVRADGLSADDAAKIKDEVDAVTKDLQDIADQLSAIDDDSTDDKSNDGDNLKDDEDHSDDEDRSNEKEDGDEERSKVSEQETRSILAAINRGKNLQGNDKQKQEKRQVQAFYDYVAGRVNETEARSLGIVTGNGGVTVPKTIAKQVISYAQEENPLRKFGEVHSTTSTEGYPVLTKAPTAQGHKLERDSDAIPDTAIEFEEIIMEPTEFDALGTVTKKLLKRSDVNIEQIILDELQKAYVQKEMQYMFNGNETDNVNDGALSKKAKEFKPAAVVDMTDGPAVYQTLVAFKHSLKPEVRKNSMILMNDAAEALVEGMMDKNGRPLYRIDGQLADGISGKLLGFNTVVTEGVSLADESVPAFYLGDMKSFHIQDVNGSLEVQKLDQLFALTNKMGYKIYNILDAQLIYSPLEPTVYKWIADGTASKKA